MIALSTDDRYLARFVDDLRTQQPTSIDGMKPDFGRLSDADVEAGRLVWAARIADEYRSIVVFGELCSLLARGNAPFAAQCAIQRIIGDELRHVEVCATVNQWLGGRDDLAIDLTEMALPPSDAPALDRAFEIVLRELVVAETESVRAMAAYRDATSDAAVRRAMELLLADEVRHATAGRHLARELAPLVSPEMRAEADQIVAAERTYIRAGYRASGTRGPGRSVGASLTREELSWG